MAKSVAERNLLMLLLNKCTYMGSYKNETDVVFLGHGDCPEDAQYVADKVKEKCGLDVWINTICPTIGAHSGPGTVALFFMGEKRL